MDNKSKKRLIISYNKLNIEQLKLLAETYSEGYFLSLQKITKPNGEDLFFVPIETDDEIIMVKFDVKKDQKMTEEEFDKEFFNVKGDDFTGESSSEDDEKEDNPQGKDKFQLLHSDFKDGKFDRADDSSEPDEDEEG